jgi:hypothetical protein
MNVYCQTIDTALSFGSFRRLHVVETSIPLRRNGIEKCRYKNTTKYFISVKAEITRIFLLTYRQRSESNPGPN